MSEKKYSKEHEWISLENEIATVGITNHAQDSLGDIVFIELPEIGKISINSNYFINFNNFTTNWRI